MALTDTKIKSLKPGEKPYKVSDGNGLVLIVTPNSSLWWRQRYFFDGKEKMISLGTYPEVTLASARKKSAESRELIAAGVDPSAKRQTEKRENVDTFEAVFYEWFAKNNSNWVVEHARIIKRSIEKNIIPYLGNIPITKIEPKDILKTIQLVENRGSVVTGRKIKNIISQVYRFAIASGNAVYDPTSSLSDALRKPTHSNFHAITDPKPLGILLKAIDGYQGGIVVKTALQLQPHVFLRPGTLSSIEWGEIDFDNAIIEIPAEKMKKNEPLIVPLSRQSIEILRTVQPLTGRGKFVFPNSFDEKKTISHSSLTVALNILGYKDSVNPHGFRATARTLLDEVLQFRPDIIEMQLAHKVKDFCGRSYNRTQHLPERRKMMQTWSDYLDGLKSGAKVIPCRRTGTMD
jgi:integrase